LLYIAIHCYIKKGQLKVLKKLPLIIKALIKELTMSKEITSQQEDLIKKQKKFNSLLDEFKKMINEFENLIDQKAPEKGEPNQENSP
tara:strand:- start:2130 stop:2390 length:261 start_codon:yes stop_codon:yes gene_type:complete